MSRITGQSFEYDVRLHYPWQYRRFFANNEVIKLRECTIFRIPNGLEHFRLGITLKARGSSVDRNKTKRQIRESFRNMRSQLGSFDYNVVVPGHRKMLFPYPDLLGTCLRNDFPKTLAKLAAAGKACGP